MANTKVNNPYNIDSIKENYISSSDIIEDVNRDIYGLEADFVNSKFTRLEDAVGKSAGADFDSCNAFGGRRRCNLTLDGTVTAYYGDPAYTTTGKLTQAVGNYPVGTLVQVMVEQPKFYYKIEPVELVKGSRENEYSTSKMRYYVSDYQHEGFKIHPAFIVNGIEKDKIYVSAYDACIYDTSDDTFKTIESKSTVDSLLNTGKLFSKSGLVPARYITWTESRTLAQNNGTGWQQSYINTVSATQLLMIIEYGQFNMQAALGDGYVNDSAAKTSGSTDTLGSASGVVNASISYRGEEDFWGNIATWIDGFVLMNNVIYTTDHDFTSPSTSEPYTMSGYSGNSFSMGYVSKFSYNSNIDHIFVANEFDGWYDQPVGDDSVSDSGSYVGLFNSYWGSGSDGGPFYLYLYLSSSDRSSGSGARLVYIPTVKPKASFKYHFINTEDLMIQPDINDLPKDFDFLFASAAEIEDGYRSRYRFSKSGNELPILKYFKIYIEVERLYQNEIIVERIDPPDEFYEVSSKSGDPDPDPDIPDPEPDPDLPDPGPSNVNVDIDLFFVKQNHYHTTVNIYYYPDDNIHNIDLNALNGCIITATPDSGRYGDLIKYSVETNEETDLGDGTIYVDFIRNDDGYIISSLIEKSSSLNSDFIMQPYDITIMASTENTEIHPGKSR